MGKGARRQPQRLAGKLREVRLALGLSQSELLRRLGAEDLITYHRISDYELGKNEPPLEVLLSYARLAGVCMDILVDDSLDLPAKLPAKPKHKT
jgi:transcriptional regulator with XRE-family HTH domain